LVEMTDDRFDEDADLIDWLRNSALTSRCSFTHGLIDGDGEGDERGEEDDEDADGASNVYV